MEQLTGRKVNLWLGGHRTHRPVGLIFNQDSLKRRNCENWVGCSRHAIPPWPDRHGFSRTLLMNPSDNKKTTLITKSGIKERGWTDSLITRFLGEADELRKNPIYKSAAPMQLYSLLRVEAVEETADFKEAMEKLATRKIGAKKAVVSKRKATIAWASSLPPPELEAVSRKDLTRTAIEDYNYLWASRGDYDKHASTESPVDFLNRITVNFIRHELTDYENRILQSYGMVGKQEAILRIKHTILDAIANAYPWLAGECKSQKSKLNSGYHYDH